MLRAGAGGFALCLLALASAGGAPPAGFNPPTETLFAPVVALAPPGPHRAERALQILDRQLRFQRKISFHPKFDPALDKVLDQLPPRQSTLIRAAALYSREDIPWDKTPDGTHRIAVAGAPDGIDYRYSLAPEFGDPVRPDDFAGEFALRPADGSSAGEVSSVIAELKGRLTLDTHGLGAIVDATSAATREVYGDLAPPWDSAPGAFNLHDRAALARFRRDFPALAARLDHYLEVDNVLDEFAGDAGGPVVLVNLDARVRPGSLAPFPHLADFYRRFAPLVTVESMIDDGHGHQWLHAAFERGRIRMVFMIRSGELTPFNSDLTPAGEPVDLSALHDGNYHAMTSIRVRRLGMDFGLDELRFTTRFHREADAVTFRSRMDTPPVVIAPPLIRQVVELIVANFMRTLAQGNQRRGLEATLSSRRAPDGMIRFAGEVSGEFRYSPTLSFLARIGDEIAEAHNEQVRKDERRLGEELFDAFVADYDRARPQILKLDGDVAQ